LNGVITFPYTAYKNIYQLEPGTVTKLKGDERIVSSYWLPQEHYPYKDLKEASLALREGITDYINKVTKNMDEIAQFISAGEDSRSVLGMLPKQIKRDSYIFLDNLNREGLIARKIAKIYGVDFNLGLRSKTHYLDILPKASKLLGTGHQYIHAHSLGFDQKFKLSHYSAVFGGFLSDTLLKGHHVKKFRGYGYLPFLPQLTRRNASPIGERFGKAGSYVKYGDQVKERQIERLNVLKELRPNSADEWFHYYPCSMHNDMPNLYINRRLFKSYEPFMSKKVVKISAKVPTSWKLNRKLFNKSFRPYLKPSKWLLHADGRLPYFNYYVNMPVQISVRFYRKLLNILGFTKGNQGPWGDWHQLFMGEKWKKTLEEYNESTNEIELFYDEVNINTLLQSDSLKRTQKLNLLQILHKLRRSTLN